MKKNEVKKTANDIADKVKSNREMISELKIDDIEKKISEKKKIVSKRALEKVIK